MQNIGRPSRHIIQWKPTNYNADLDCPSHSCNRITERTHYNLEILHAHFFEFLYLESVKDDTKKIIKFCTGEVRIFPKMLCKNFYLTISCLASDDILQNQIQLILNAALAICERSHD